VTETLFETSLRSLPLLGRGKVRDIYAVDDDHLLIVATDRLSAFDVVLPTPIPGKGAVLTALTDFWFERTADLVANHRATMTLAEAVPDAAERALVAGRAVVARRLSPLPIEAIARGYLVGSGWKDYQRTGALCGIPLPAGLRQAERLPEPLFTPSTKAAVGDHDENISLDRAADLIGREVVERVAETALAIYRRALEHARARGIIVADSKFEFALDPGGALVLIDEVVTPDSSRFWPADAYAPGSNPPSFDKQYVRDYLEGIGWNKRPPASALPDAVVARTAAKYREALDRLTAETP